MNAPVRWFLILLTLVVVCFELTPPALAADTLYFLHTDHLGSTRVITDKTGTVVAKYDYYPYGSINNQLPPFAEASGGGPTTNSLPTERLYTSQISDESTDLYFYNARYYNPEIGNFISADAADGSYVYVGGNPVNKTDPSGNREEEGAGNFLGACHDNQMGWCSGYDFDSNGDLAFASGNQLISFWFSGVSYSKDFPESVKEEITASYLQLPVNLRRFSKYFLAYDPGEDATFAGYTFPPVDPIVFNSRFFESKDVVTHVAFHEMAHNFQKGYKTDYLTRSGPYMAGNIPVLEPGEKVTALEVIRYLAAGAIDQKPSGDDAVSSYRSLVSNASIPADAYALKNWEEFGAESFAAFAAPRSFLVKEGYKFPFGSSGLRKLTSFYRYLYSLD